MPVTIYDIAARARVSIATVSRVFNEHPRVSEATRRKVFRVAEDLGYQPHASAQSLARQTTQLVSAVVPMTTSLFFMEVLRGVQDRLDASAYDLLVYASSTPDRVDGQIARAVQRGRSDGLLLVSTPVTAERARRITASRRAVVLVDAAHESFDSVWADSRRGGHVAVRHLAEQGHRRIGLLMPAGTSGTALERRAGYLDGLAEVGIEPDERLAVSAEWDLNGDGDTRTAGYRGMKTLLERFSANPDGRPTAVFIASDVMALGALRAVHEAGLRLPDGLQVVGFDDTAAAAYAGLTALAQPAVEMGRLAAETLLRRLRDPSAPLSHAVFAPRLVAREAPTIDR